MPIERGLILLIGSTKGGVTKSTLCENLSVEFVRLGYRVCLIDADHQQRTLSKWADRRNGSIENGEKLAYLPCFIKEGRIKNDCLELAKDYDVVIVDTGGKESAELRSALMCADIVYLPTQVSQNSLESLEELEVILDETEEINPDRKVFGLVVQAPTNPNSKQKTEAKEFLAQFSDRLALSDCTTYHRTSYCLAPRSGASVIEWHDKKAKSEIQLLAKEIITHAKK